MLVVIGGRTGTVGETLTIDVYDTETSEWSKFNSIQRFRYSSFINKDILHGWWILPYMFMVGLNWIRLIYLQI